MLDSREPTTLDDLDWTAPDAEDLEFTELRPLLADTLVLEREETEELRLPRVAVALLLD